MRYLLVGDVHATKNELEDCQKLIDHVIKVAKEDTVDKIVFMGDIYNTHSILDLAVIRFWTQTFSRIHNENIHDITVLVGNHDQSNPKNLDSPNSVSLHESQVNVVSSPQEDLNGVLYVPYYADNQVFVENCNKFNNRLLICHQTFDGSKFENGFYAKDGVDPNLLKAPAIISGHIHSAQEFGKVQYIGSPRWRTASDANEKKAIWVLDIENGIVINKKYYSTDRCCTPIYSRCDSEDQPLHEELNLSANYIIDITGSKDYILKRTKELKHSNTKVRTHIIQKSFKIKESDGINIAFKQYLEEFILKNNIVNNEFYKLVKERISWIR